jgi:23S rRNA (cytidine1920-2'-O)/16S rRNA (cytidine1409-2'-O)-methyltransferase
LAPTRSQAQDLIATGSVLVSGALANRPARLVAPNEPVVLATRRPRFVSRGGEKLSAALTQFGVEVTGRIALDVGASTGGFTDCLLQRGAAGVVALDVGRGQLHERLVADPRVRNQERTNLRGVDRQLLPEAPFALIVGDLAFISLTAVASDLVDLGAPGSDLVLLVKPQFEAGRRVVSKGRGVVRDPAVWAAALERVGTAIEAQGAAMIGAMVSPLRGADGNVEFLVHFRSHQSASPGVVAQRLAIADLVVSVDAGTED